MTELEKALSTDNIPQTQRETLESLQRGLTPPPEGDPLSEMVNYVSEILGLPQQGWKIGFGYHDSLNRMAKSIIDPGHQTATLVFAPEIDKEDLLEVICHELSHVLIHDLHHITGTSLLSKGDTHLASLVEIFAERTVSNLGEVLAFILTRLRSLESELKDEQLPTQ